jgi:uncharacterized membrane protein YbaN (DUF454 family)
MRVIRAFWVIVGTLFLAIGALGLILPVLPTTIFVLLAAFAYAKGSPELRAWLDNNRTFGPMIAEWEAHGAIAPRYKAIAVGMMAAVFGVSIAASLSVTILIVQAACMSLAAAYILTRPSGPAS